MTFVYHLNKNGAIVVAIIQLFISNPLRYMWLNKYSTPIPRH